MTTKTQALPVASSKMPFGFCQSGHHDICPGRINAPVATRVMKGGQVVKVMVQGQIECSCTGCLCRTLVRCLACKHRSSQDVDPQTWSCLDQDACAARREANLLNNSFMQQIREIERTRAMSTATEEKPVREAKPKVGNCLCCGEETKGGKFLPGHDARFVSEQVAFVLQGSRTEDQARESLADTSDALKAKFEKSLGLAREKAERKKAEAAQAKEDKADTKASAKEAEAEAGAEVVAEAEAALEAEGEGTVAIEAESKPKGGKRTKQQ